MYLFIYICICVPAGLPACLCLSVRLSVFLHRHVCVYVSVYLSIYPFIYLPIHLLYLCNHLYVLLSASVPVYLPIIYLSMQLCIYQVFCRTFAHMSGCLLKVGLCCRSSQKKTKRKLQKGGFLKYPICTTTRCDPKEPSATSSALSVCHQGNCSQRGHPRLNRSSDMLFSYARIGRLNTAECLL
jgi:hypothetical protein